MTARVPFERTRNGGDFQGAHCGKKTFPSGPCNAQHEWFYLVSIDVYRWLFIISYGGIAKEPANLSDLVGGTAGPKSLADVFFGGFAIHVFIYSFWSGLLESFTERLSALREWFISPFDLFVFELSSLPVVRNLISRLK